MKTHEEIMLESARAREKAKEDSFRWSEGTRYTPESLEGIYEDYVVIELEAGNNEYLDFETFCMEELGIPNE